jgi:4-amino-4-deoxy-L-arabinose transferase-like glycosyltransferase
VEIRRLATKLRSKGVRAADLVGAGLAAVAVAIAVLTGLRGINGPFPDGHYSAQAAVGIFADNMWRWHTVLPIWGYLEHAPTGPEAYMNHPPGMFWVAALLARLFGFSNWLLRVPPILYVGATAFFLYRIGKELWGAIPGGLAALGFVALPITLGYANYQDLEQPVMLGCVVAAWGYVRFVRTWRDRYALFSVLGFLFALNHDWWAYIWGALFLGGLFVRAYLLPERRLPPLPPRAFGRYWALMCGAAVLSLGVEGILLKESGRISSLMTAAFQRSSGSGAPLRGVLDARWYRIDLMFTWLAILLGKLAVPVMFWRAASKRSDLELLVPIPLLLAAVGQYVIFRQGADVHIFWPHPFAVYFGLAVGALAASVGDAVAWAAKRARGPVAARVRPLAGWAALAVVGLPVLVILADGLSLVRLGRETGGRFVEAQLESQIDRVLALRWFVARLPPEAGVGFVGQSWPTWGQQWELRPRTSMAHQPPGGPYPAGQRALFLDTRTATPADLRSLAGRFKVHAVGSFWFVDRLERAGPLDAYVLDEREPSWRERWSQGDTEPTRTVRPDAWATWEWRTLLGQTATAPRAAPVTTDQLRVAHNVAKAAGDEAASARLATALRARLDLPLHARYENGTELLGAVHARGAARSLTLFFRAGAFKTDSRFAVRASVIAPPRFSTLPRDPAELDLSMAPAWPTSLWRPGHIYSVKVVYRRRPGQERLVGAWVPDLARLDGKGPLEIARL